jgi:YebC/PmpR family DNA-binding regulatory protein
MAGHSKWAQIKRQKGINDTKRGALFTKLGNQIAIAARSGTDPETNFTLRMVIDTAKAANMPMSNIERAIQRVADKSAAQVEEVLYEGYGPGGVAVLIECATDNRNRTYPEVRNAFNKHGGSVAEPGSVSFQFTHKGIIRIKGTGDELLLAALDAGADDVEQYEDESVAYTDAKQLAHVRDALLTSGFDLVESSLGYEPNSRMVISDAETARKVMRLMDALDELDDTVQTYTNFEIADNLNVE